VTAIKDGSPIQRSLVATDGQVIASSAASSTPGHYNTLGAFLRAGSATDLAGTPSADIAAAAPSKIKATADLKRNRRAHLANAAHQCECSKACRARVQKDAPVQLR